MNNEYITKAQAIEVAESLRPIAGNGITGAFIKGIEGVEGCRLIKNKEPVDGKTIAIKLSPKIDKKLSREWISTKDRLPSDNETVLFWGYGDIEIGQHDTETKRWLTEEFPYEERKVTHWMPLPEPPKE